MPDRVRLRSVATALPAAIRTSAEVETLIRDASPGYRLKSGIVEALSGIATRRVADTDVQCSDLAAQAARTALRDAALDARDVDLLIFAAASQDLMEPATANLVQEKVGTTCQVFDVKNACNSFLNGLQIAESMILSGSCEVALVVSGEVCSRAISWRVRSHAEFKQNFPGYTMGDAGAAAVLTRSTDGRGIFYRRFSTVSSHWHLATIACGGSMHPRGEEHTYLRADGAALKRAFMDLGPKILCGMLRDAGVTLGEFDRILVHQPTLPYLDELLRITGTSIDRVEETVAEFGNMAAASLPVAHARAVARGAIASGDRVLWLGLASGISVGTMMIDV